MYLPPKTKHHYGNFTHSNCIRKRMDTFISHSTTPTTLLTTINKFGSKTRETIHVFVRYTKTVRLLFKATRAERTVRNSVCARRVPTLAYKIVDRQHFFFTFHHTSSSFMCSHTNSKTSPCDVATHLFPLHTSPYTDNMQHTISNRTRFCPFIAALCIQKHIFMRFCIP